MTEGYYSHVTVLLFVLSGHAQHDTALYRIMWMTAWDYLERHL